MTDIAASDDRWAEEADAAVSDRQWYDAANPEPPPEPDGAAVWVWSPKGGTGTSTVAALIAARAAAHVDQIAAASDVVVVDCSSGDLRHLFGLSRGVPQSHLAPETSRSAAAVEDYAQTLRHNYGHQGLTDLRAHAAAKALLADSESAGPGLRLVDLSDPEPSSPTSLEHRAFPQLLSALCAVSPVVVVDAGKDPSDRGVAVLQQLPDARPAAVLRNCYLSLAQSQPRPQEMLDHVYLVEEPRRALDRRHVQPAAGASTVTGIALHDSIARSCDAGTFSTAPAAGTRFDLPPNVTARISAFAAQPPVAGLGAVSL